MKRKRATYDPNAWFPSWFPAKYSEERFYSPGETLRGVKCPSSVRTPSVHPCNTRRWRFDHFSAGTMVPAETARHTDTRCLLQHQNRSEQERPSYCPLSQRSVLVQIPLQGYEQDQDHPTHEEQQNQGLQYVPRGRGALCCESMRSRIYHYLIPSIVLSYGGGW